MNDDQHFYRPVSRVDIRKENHPSVERESAVRLYCYYSGVDWCLQVRAPLRRKDGSESKDFVVASAHLDVDAMLALRDAIDKQLATVRDKVIARRIEKLFGLEAFEDPHTGETLYRQVERV